MFVKQTQIGADCFFLAQVPMVAPFFGCTFGGFLYDVFLFTGESPINTPYWGLYRFIPSLREKYRGMRWEKEDLKEDSEA